MSLDPFEEAALEEVAYGTQHSLNVLLNILIEKGIITEQEFMERLESVSETTDDEQPSVDE